jgi:hypothetical protein
LIRKFDPPKALRRMSKDVKSKGIDQTSKRLDQSTVISAMTDKASDAAVTDHRTYTHAHQRRTLLQHLVNALGTTEANSKRVCVDAKTAQSRICGKSSRADSRATDFDQIARCRVLLTQ